MIIRALACVWLLVTMASLGPALARQDDERLGPLFEQLLDAESVQQAETTVRVIWGIWYESGDESVDRLLVRGIVAMNAGRFDIALRYFNEVVEADPEFAEGWNKRATVHWLMDNFDESMDDIQRTLSLEPRHFGAVSGMGLIFMEQGDTAGALRAFEQVLRINPRDTGARRRVQELRERLNEDAV